MMGMIMIMITMRVKMTAMVIIFFSLRYYLIKVIVFQNYKQAIVMLIKVMITMRVKITATVIIFFSPRHAYLAAFSRFGWSQVIIFLLFIKLLECPIPPLSSSSQKIRITSPLAVFLKLGQMDFSKASNSISHHLTSIFPRKK